MATITRRLTFSGVKKANYDGNKPHAFWGQCSLKWIPELQDAVDVCRKCCIQPRASGGREVGSGCCYASGSWGAGFRARKCWSCQAGTLGLWVVEVQSIDGFRPGGRENWTELPLVWHLIKLSSTRDNVGLNAQNKGIGSDGFSLPSLGPFGWKFHDFLCSKAGCLQRCPHFYCKQQIKYKPKQSQNFGAAVWGQELISCLQNGSRIVEEKEVYFFFLMEIN